MTHKQFVAKYQNKFVDFDGKFGNQCVDLMRQYIKEVMGLNPYTLTPQRYAKDIWYNFEKMPLASKHFLKIKNTPTAVPVEGDLIFWTTYPFVTGIAGHVAIYDNGNVNRFVSLDQNYPTGSPCHLQAHSYKGVLGWLRKK